MSINKRDWMIASICLVSCITGCSDRAPSSAPNVDKPTAVEPTAPPPPPPSAAPQAVAGRKNCTVKVTGDVTADFVGLWEHNRGDDDAKLAVSSDYWMTDTEMHENVDTLVRILDYEHKKTPAQLQQEAAERLKQDPKIAIASITCITEAGKLTLGPGAKSHYKDVPYAAKSYRIGGDDAAAGEFKATLGLGAPPTFFNKPEGKLEITKFDSTGLAGTFNFVATSREGKSVKVSGTLDYPCNGRSLCKP
jgi:hypothetical protein